MKHLSGQRVAIVAGARTPFVKAGKAFASQSPLSLATHAVSELLERRGIEPRGIDAIAYGAVVPEPGRPNLAREIVQVTDLPRGIEGQTISSYCITGLRTVVAVAEAIAVGRIEAGIAGGVEWLSGAAADTFREPTTGLLMGEHTEITRRDWRIQRSEQDRLALDSHAKAVAARAHLAQEIIPLAGVEHDTGPRPGSSLEALAALPAAFDDDGTLTAGNSSPVTDGASAVVLMSEARARAEGHQPLAFLRAAEFAAIDPADGLLMAPGVAVPRLLSRTGISIDEIDLIEIHEAFAAQVLANVLAWQRGWKGPSLGEIDWAKVNVNGSSLAIGHPWSATGGRIVTTLANEMVRRDASHGLVSICAAGGMAGALLLERS